MTNQDQIIANLTTLGGNEVLCRSGKYRCVEFGAHEVGVAKPDGRLLLVLRGTYWVGKAGALRQGRTVSESLSVTDAFRFGVLAHNTRQPHQAVTVTKS